MAAVFQVPEAPPTHTASLAPQLAAPVVKKLAVTDFAALMVTVQGAVPVQAPDQPANVDPEFGVAVSATTFPVG